MNTQGTWRACVSLSAVVAVLGCALGGSAASASASSGAEISSYIGSTAAGPAPATSVGMAPWAVGMAGSSLLVADINGGVIRRITSTGSATVVAGDGGFGAANGDGGLATAAGLSEAGGVAADASGDVYISDSGNSRIRLVAGASCSSSCPFGLASTTAHHIYTIAGGGSSGLGDGGPATSASLNSPQGVSLDAGGDLLIADWGNSLVRLVAASSCTTGCPFGLPSTTRGYIYTIAGGGTSALGDGGPATSASLRYPRDVRVDAHGDLLIADSSNQRMRIVAASSCASGCPFGLASTTKGDIYTIAGNGTAGYSGDGGPATAAEISDPHGVAADSRGDLIIPDSDNGRVRLVAVSACSSACPFGLASMTTGDVYTIAHDASGYPAYPLGITLDSHGDLLIADDGSSTVRLRAVYTCSSSCPFGLPSMTAGAMYVIGGNGSPGLFGDGGRATAAGLSYPKGVIGDSAGDVFVADSTDNRVRFRAGASCTSNCPFGLPSTTLGDIYTVAGTGTLGASGDGGPATSARIWAPNGVTLDAAGDLLIADTWNSRVRFVAAHSCTTSCPFNLGTTTAGDIYTVAGTGDPSYSGDGGPATAAAISNPDSAAVDSHGDLLISDTFNARVRFVAAASCSSACPFGRASTVAGDIYTIAGTGQPGFSGDGGPGTQAAISGPAGTAVDARGDLLLADAGNRRVRLVAIGSCTSGCPFGHASLTAGDIYTVAGSGAGGYAGDGGPALSAGLSLDGTFTSGVAVDSHGNLLIGDTDNHRVRVVAKATCSSACAFGLSSTVAGDIYTVAGGGTKGLGDTGPATSGQLSYPSGVWANARGDLFVGDAKDQRVRVVALPPRNTAPPVISGTPQNGQTLTTTTGTWVAPSHLTYSYQWQRCTSTGTSCLAISGASSGSYVLTSADVGHKIDVLVVATDAEGQLRQAAAAPVGPVS